MAEPLLAAHETNASNEFETDASDAPEESFGEDGSDDGEDDDDDGDDEAGEDDGGDASSFTGASDLEEEAQYHDQPACGLSPRLVVRRGCEALQALDPPADGADLAPTAPPLTRVDTVVGFERAVGRAGDPLANPVADNAAALRLTRSETMSGLPEVQEAFAAVAEEVEKAGNGASATNGSAPDATFAADPLAVRRIDTMELLQDMAPSAAADDEAERAAKRQRKLAA